MSSTRVAGYPRSANAERAASRSRSRVRAPWAPTTLPFFSVVPTAPPFFAFASGIAGSLRRRMDPEVESLLARRFRIPPSSEDKTMSLRDAVERFVRPGDAIHLGLTHTRGGVALWEILRRFHGTNPGFELLGVQLSSPPSPLVHAGLARRLVTSWAGDSYFAPGPSPVYQRAWKEGIEFEHWSILTYVQRLAAGARG